MGGSERRDDTRLLAGGSVVVNLKVLSTLIYFCDTLEAFTAAMKTHAVMLAAIEAAQVRQTRQRPRSWANASLS